MHYFQRLALLGVGLAHAWLVDAQATTTAVCSVDLWTFNAENDSPCLVAAALQGICNGGNWDIPALQKGLEYTGPLQGQSNKCECSTVVYSLVAACGACQGGSIETWEGWKLNCTSTDISVASFPLSIPPDTTVPSWAYLDVTVEGFWDANAALKNHDSGAPDSSAGSPTATITATPTPA